jgi:glycosyltransferase involved in cell wall biosynthesis
MTADTIGGVWSYTVELLQALAAHPCEVMLATMGAPLSQSQRFVAAQLPNVTIMESAYKLEWMNDPWAHVDASGEWLMELARDFRPDLVHLNNFAHGALPWKAPVVVVGHSCVLSWWQAVKRVGAPPTWATYQRRVQAGLARADMVVAPTKAMLADLNTYYGPFRASQTIYNGRNSADFAPGEKEDFIFTMGRVWDEAKNIAILNQIAGQLSWPVYVAGEQRHPNGGHVALDNLHTLGHLSQFEVREWLARASIFVLPARYEPFGLAILEAALSGCVLVLGDILTLRELWEDSALYVPPENSSMLKHCLEYLAISAKRRRMLAESAYKRAQMYSPGNMGNAYWNLYQELVANVGPTRLLHGPQGSVLTLRTPNIPVWQNNHSNSGIN